MARLHEFFKTYIANQIANDPTWRRVDIIYSGHDVSSFFVFISYSALHGFLRVSFENTLRSISIQII